MDEQTARREIVRVGKLLYERGSVVSSDGNVSVRLDDGRIVATPTQTCKGRMGEDALAVTDIEGRPPTNRKSSRELATPPQPSRAPATGKVVSPAPPPHGSALAVAG